MATQPFRSLVLDILRVVRDAALHNEQLTAAEIFGRLDDRFYRYDFDPLWSRLARPDPQDREGAMAQLLNELTDLGLVAPHGDREESSGIGRWRIAESWQPPTPTITDGEGGNVPPPQDGGNQAGGPDDGGGGLREALSHPVLFALDLDDFEQLLEGLFETTTP